MTRTSRYSRLGHDNSCGAGGRLTEQSRPGRSSKGLLLLPTNCTAFLLTGQQESLNEPPAAAKADPADADATVTQGEQEGTQGTTCYPVRNCPCYPCSFCSDS
jgi:hypothetical protein